MNSADVDTYLTGTLIKEENALVLARKDSEATGLAAHAVSPIQGAFLQIMTKAISARRVLEIGTLGGYSTIWMARALPADGELVTLELDENHAEIAKKNIARARLECSVSLMQGEAIISLDQLIESEVEPFDLIFVDADKPNNPVYLDRSLKLSRPGTLIIGDNVIREGEVANMESNDPSIIGVRSFLELMGSNPCLDVTALQTIGSKGHDGFSLAFVNR